MITQILRYGRRIKQLGYKKLFLTMKYRFHKKLFRFCTSNNSWPDVSKKLGVTQKFEDYFNQVRQNKTFETIFDNINNQPQNIKQTFDNCFSILGSKNICLGNNEIEWQKDFKTEQLKDTHKILENQWQNQKNIFYQDIKISSPKNMGLHDYNPDIKVPWELSRFQHLVNLATAYKKTHDSKYIATYKYHMESWIESNPARRGVNWVCPMDTAIRTINWIHGLHQFKNETNLSLEFWQKIVCSLYDHAIFIENNWEWSDKPNNHYLADLLGYIYLCEFFRDSSKFKVAKSHAIKTILEQFFHQISPDGTAYEGSTNYHKLDTEIFLHFQILCQITQTPLPQEFHDRLRKMQEFLQDCTDVAGNLAQIGDNDSGKIVSGTKIQKSSNNIVQTYANFGLTIIKNKDLHLTFRHATFNPNQPTGHFHQDQLAITLSVNGIPILIDPGTYVYTANTNYRNMLRSAESHNTFYMNQEIIPDDLFQLKRDACMVCPEPTISHEKISLKSTYSNGFTTSSRKLEMDLQTNDIKIRDRAENQKDNLWTWNLVFAPNITIEKIDTNLWKIKKEKTNLLSIESTLNLEEKNWFYSAEYGKIEPCKKLTTQKRLLCDEYITIKPPK